MPSRLFLAPLRGAVHGPEKDQAVSCASAFLPACLIRPMTPLLRPEFVPRIQRGVRASVNSKQRVNDRAHSSRVPNEITNGIGERHVVIEAEESRRKVNCDKPVFLRKKQQVLQVNWFGLSAKEPTPKVDSFAFGCFAVTSHGLPPNAIQLRIDHFFRTAHPGCNGLESWLHAHSLNWRQELCVWDKSALRKSSGVYLIP